MDDAIRVCGRGEEFLVAVALGDEAFDGALNLDVTVHDSLSVSAFCTTRRPRLAAV